MTVEVPEGRRVEVVGKAGIVRKLPRRQEAVKAVLGQVIAVGQIKEYKSEKGYLIDTCLNAQDQYMKMIEYYLK